MTIIMHGNILHGYQFVGPFANALAALEYLDKHRSEIRDEFHLIPLARPKA